MTLPVKKVHIDTAHKTTDSASNSSFRFELPESLTMPEQCVFYVDDIAVPHSWYSIEAGLNDRFFIHILQSTNYLYKAIPVPPGIYTGASLATALTAGLNATGPAGRPTTFTVAYLAATHRLQITASYTDTSFKVLTTQDLATKLNGAWIGDAYDAKRPQDINGEVLKQTEGLGASIPHGTSWFSEVISLQPIRSVYLYSPNLGSFHTIGPTGEASIIKVIPVTAGPGFMIFDQVTASNDYLDCSRQTLRTLEFQLKDVHGNLVPLHGSHLSFSLVFDLLDTRS